MAYVPLTPVMYVLGLLPDVVDAAILIAELGRWKGEGEGARDGSSGVVEDDREEGCWRIAKTKVLFIASLAHCGWATYRSWR